MTKPECFFYSFPTGGPKFSLWPTYNKCHRLEVDGKILGEFDDLERAIVAASASFTDMHEDAHLAKTAEQMLDIDWWERSPTRFPNKALN